jgi:hypothetical protein
LVTVIDHVTTSAGSPAVIDATSAVFSTDKSNVSLVMVQ